MLLAVLEAALGEFLRTVESAVVAYYKKAKVGNEFEHFANRASKYRVNAVLYLNFPPMFELRPPACRLTREGVRLVLSDTKVTRVTPGGVYFGARPSILSRRF